VFLSAKSVLRQVCVTLILCVSTLCVLPLPRPIPANVPTPSPPPPSPPPPPQRQAPSDLSPGRAEHCRTLVSLFALARTSPAPREGGPPPHRTRPQRLLRRRAQRTHPRHTGGRTSEPPSSCCRLSTDERWLVSTTTAGALLWSRAASISRNAFTSLGDPAMAVTPAQPHQEGSRSVNLVVGSPLPVKCTAKGCVQCQRRHI
jgi:hypothetical protein